MCCVKYNVCEENTNDGFSLDNFMDAMNMPAALVESQCTQDFIIIEGADSECCFTTTTNRYCGARLNTISGNTGGNPATAARDNREICDCTPPFLVTFMTDNLPDPNIPAANQMLGRGVCLKYTQVPCGTP